LNGEPALGRILKRGGGVHGNDNDGGSERQDSDLQLYKVTPPHRKLYCVKI